MCVCVCVCVGGPVSPCCRNTHRMRQSLAGWGQPRLLLPWSVLLALLPLSPYPHPVITLSFSPCPALLTLPCPPHPALPSSPCPPHSSHLILPSSCSPHPVLTLPLPCPHPRLTLLSPCPHLAPHPALTLPLTLPSPCPLPVLLTLSPLTLTLTLPSSPLLLMLTLPSPYHQFSCCSIFFLSFSLHKFHFLLLSTFFFLLSFPSHLLLIIFPLFPFSHIYVFCTSYLLLPSLGSLGSRSTRLWVFPYLNVLRCFAYVPWFYHFILLLFYSYLFFCLSCFFGYSSSSHFLSSVFFFFFFFFFPSLILSVSPLSLIFSLPPPLFPLPRLPSPLSYCLPSFLPQFPPYGIFQ